MYTTTDSVDIRIYNDDCFRVMEGLPVGAVNVILTSPPYNTSRDRRCKTLADATPGYPTYRYDVHSDGMSDAEYKEWTVNLFREFTRIVNLGGCVLYNLSYGRNGASPMLQAIAAITEHTTWRCFDIIYWRKKTAMPDNQSPNKLTRLVEPVFVFVREGEKEIFAVNKKLASTRESGQSMYSPIYNIFDAANNDGENNLNKATFSSQFARKLLEIYGRPGEIVFDPFCGTGTTAVACKQLGMHFIGSEISEAQCEYAVQRLQQTLL